jgi:squalene-hopene/tetraprenyl-beta-curcumene cyclase
MNGTPHSAPLSHTEVRNALATATATLLEQFNAQGFWEGELSTSALSTATAVIALTALRKTGLDQLGDDALIERGIHWLATNQNEDGGWGDTTKSISNISTTALAWAAFSAAEADDAFPIVVNDASTWLSNRSAQSVPANFSPDWRSRLAEAIRRRYGKDRTFSVPILTACTIAGRLGNDGWREVPALPFELAALPQRLYGVLQLPVVSYALPALIAIGQVVHHHRPSRILPLRWLRSALRQRTLAILESIQPPNGGFLEATPLTSFVLMSLCHAGHSDTLVALRCASFIRASVRADGSWPIDTHLATWGTTLAVKALAHQEQTLTPEQRQSIRAWLLNQQFNTTHPYTGAAPGGWAWTPLPGGVPDADDTPGALLALAQLGAVDGDTEQSVAKGVRWLLDLQNRDGGIPTFCRGWGALPFDQSSPDLTAHTLRAWSAWLPQLPPPLQSRVESGITAALAYLQKTRQPNGGWIPLWFGNQHSPDETNVVYGTACVVIALRDLKNRGILFPPDLLQDAIQLLSRLQRPDGSWCSSIASNAMSSDSNSSGSPSIEETALAVEALAGTAKVGASDRGARWLIRQINTGEWTIPSPIGFYFARLWYYEKLYPLIFTTAALGKVARHLPPTH